LIIMSNFEAAVLTSPSITSLSSSSGANVAPPQPLTSSGISPSPTSSPQSSLLQFLFWGSLWCVAAATRATSGK
jgi:hypothetical protein